MVLLLKRLEHPRVLLSFLRGDVFQDGKISGKSAPQQETQDGDAPRPGQRMCYRGQLGLL